MVDLEPLHRGAVVRKTLKGIDYYGTIVTPPNRKRGLRARVVWHPEFGTWEEGDDLVVVDFLARAPK